MTGAVGASLPAAAHARRGGGGGGGGEHIPVAEGNELVGYREVVLELM